MTVLLGAIADDFTGATDLANTLVKQGMRAVQTIGVPSEALDLGDAQAVVVALKTRTAPTASAVDASMAALKWLRDLGADQFLFKYCSTFDSTPSGNIGPVADSLMEALGADIALVCPAFPANGRTVYQGHLFVADQLLSDSPMRDHPLTPMQDSSLVRLMAAQTSRKVGLISHATVVAGATQIAAAIDALRREGVAYAVADAITDEDLMHIGAAASGHRLITGGSGVALGLPDNFSRAGQARLSAESYVPAVTGREIVIAGSCSQATRGQIQSVEGIWPCRKLDAHRIAAGEPVADEVAEWVESQPAATPVLVYASADPTEVAAIQDRYGRERAGEMIESTCGAVARGLVGKGFRRMIVAGGETSGAVVSALRITGLRIGAEIDPGVPWTETLHEPRIAVALKSGNFGCEDFFVKAFEMLP